MSRLTRLASRATLILGALTISASADTIHVPDDYPTIAGAIAAASSGDTIEISSGIFNEHGISVYKPLTIRGQGMDATIIDAQQLGRCMTVTAVGEVNLEKLTIRNGRSGIEAGGAFISGDAQATLTEVRFLNNRAGTTFQKPGGALFRTGSNSNPDAMLIIRRCEFTGNHSSAQGGALACTLGWDNILITQTLLQDNSSEPGPDALYVQSNLDGSGLVQADVVNCTFVGHTGQRYVAYTYGEKAQVRYANCLFANNTATRLGHDSSGTDTISSCLLQPNIMLAYITEGEGNVFANAVFEDPADGDFRLAAGSPGIDMADLTPYLALDGNIFDLGGGKRLVDDLRVTDTGAGSFTHLDAGAYEHQGLTCLADINGDQAVNTLDILDFLNAWTYGCP